MVKKKVSSTFKFAVSASDGADATVYWLVPSDTQVKRKADGTCIPKVVTCKAYSKTGEGEAVALTGVIKFALLYKTGGTSGEFAYASNIIITADMAGISFRLYIGGKQLDQQTVTVIDDGPAGDAGPMGKRGVLPYPQGEWDAKTVYTATENVAPYVWYEPGKQYYVLNKVGSVSGTPPPDDYISAKNWVPLENNKAVYAEILMTRFAKLASAVFWGDYMFSQFGINEYGNDDENYERFDPSLIGKPDCPYTPNIMLNFAEGEAIFNKALIRGDIYSKKGIFSGGIQSKTKMIQITGSGGTPRLIFDPSENTSYAVVIKTLEMSYDKIVEIIGSAEFVGMEVDIHLNVFNNQINTSATNLIIKPVSSGALSIPSMSLFGKEVSDVWMKSGMHLKLRAVPAYLSMVQGNNISVYASQGCTWVIVNSGDYKIDAGHARPVAY